MTTRVFIADDHEVIRLGLRALLQGSGIEVVGEASSGDKVLDLVAELRPHIALVDVRLPRMDGLRVLNQIRTQEPDVQVVMMSAYDNPTFVARSVALEAAAYLLKTASRAKIIDTLRKVADGENAWTRDELRRVTGALTTPRIANDIEVPLTHRESEVLEQLAFGHTNKEIAQKLTISYETVKEHVQHILRKIGVSDRTQAAVWAVRKGLV